jgi:hypothetical protein
MNADKSEILTSQVKDKGEPVSLSSSHSLLENACLSLLRFAVPADETLDQETTVAGGLSFLNH